MVTLGKNLLYVKKLYGTSLYYFIISVLIVGVTSGLINKNFSIEIFSEVSYTSVVAGATLLFLSLTTLTFLGVFLVNRNTGGGA